MVASVYTDLLRDFDERGVQILSSETGESLITASLVVRSFFGRMCMWEWPDPVELCHYRDRASLQFAVRAWNPTTSIQDASHVMPVLTPVRPVQNTSTSVTRSTREVLRQEFWLAHCHLTRSAMLTPEHAPNTLRILVGDSPFFAAHDVFVELCVEVVGPEESEVGEIGEENEEGEENKEGGMENGEISADEMSIKESLYAFISGESTPSSKKERRREKNNLIVKEKERRRKVVEKMEEKLHSFVNFLESKMKNLICILEETRSKKFKKDNERTPGALQFIVHPFNRPFYDDGMKSKCKDNKKTELKKTEMGVVSSPPSLPGEERRGDFQKLKKRRRAHFFMALKGVNQAVGATIPIQTLVGNAKYWMDSVRSQYQFGNMSTTKDGGGGGSHAPEEAPRAKFRILKWEQLPDLVFSEKENVDHSYTRSQAKNFRDAQLAARMQMFHHHHYQQHQQQQQQQQQQQLQQRHLQQRHLHQQHHHQQHHHHQHQQHTRHQHQHHQQKEQYHNYAERQGRAAKRSNSHGGNSNKRTNTKHHRKTSTTKSGKKGDVENIVSEQQRSSGGGNQTRKSNAKKKGGGGGGGGHRQNNGGGGNHSKKKGSHSQNNSKTKKENGERQQQKKSGTRRKKSTGVNFHSNVDFPQMA